MCNFLSLTSCCLCLWRRPAQPGDGPLNAYLLSLATASATWQRPLRPQTRPCMFYLWRRPAQLGDGPRNLLTPGNTELGETSGTRNFLSLTSCCLCLWRRPAQPGDGPLNAYLLSLATASATWQRPAHPLSLTAAASANAIMLIQVIRLRLSWSNGTSPFPPLNSAKIDTCLVLSRLYEITSEIVTLYLTGYVTSPYIDSVSTSTIYVLKSELPAQNGECFKNVRTRIQSLSERKHCCLILPRPVDTECTL